MSEARRDSEVVRLTRALGPPTSVSAEVRARLAAFRTRAALERSEDFIRNKDAIDELTRALIHYPAPGASPAPPQREFVRVASWNIQRGARLDGILRFVREQPILRDADVLLLNEVDIGMARSNNRDVCAEIAAAMGFYAVFGSSYLCLGYGDAVDGQGGGENQRGLHGNAILSRYPIRRAENFSLSAFGDRFVGREKVLGHNRALWAEIESPLGELPLVAVHLDALSSPRHRHRQLLDILDKLEQRGLLDRVLLGGDFNTSTYDLESAPRLVANIATKLARGGFAHGMHHYLYPEQIYESRLFDALERAAFDYRSFNRMGAGTTCYIAGEHQSETNIRQHVPELAARILRWKLRPYNGVAELKIDWFAGRGLLAINGEKTEHADPSRGVPPTVIPRPSWDGVLLSDHYPIVVDVALGPD